MSTRPSSSDPRLRTLRLAACALALTFSATLQAAEPNYRLLIDAPEELLEPLRTRTLLGRWHQDEAFELSQLPLFIERARAEAEAIAQSAGYFSATIRVDERTGTDGRPEIRFQVVPGARATVGGLRLSIDGVEDGVRAELGNAWPLPEGAFFVAGDWELGKRQLIDQLQQRGHFRARIVESRAEIDPDTTAAVLTVSVDAGPRLAFGALDVRGLERYPSSIVADLRPFREGEPYLYAKLLAFQERLRTERWFSGVSVLPDLAAIEADPAMTTVPVIVEVRERQRKSAGFGVGFSTDQGLRGLVTYEHRDLFGRGWLLESGALLETVRHRAYVSASTPWDATGHRWQAGLRAERLDVSGELTDKRTLYFGRGRRTEQIESFVSLQYQSERGIVDVGASETSTNRSAALTLGYAWALRRLDSRIDPRQGYAISAQVSGAARGLASDRSFIRAYGRAMRFWPMPQASALEGGVLIGLLEAGTVISGGRDGIPSENLFRAGGAQSIRGYDYLGLGLRVGDAVVGGRVVAFGSLEYQHPIVGNWLGALFFDIGNAADRWPDWKPVRGAGVGLRWRSPIGPINVDIAHADADRRWRMHFSVGYSF